METIEKPFIIANTESICIDKLKNEHIIPVFSKDNTPLISQYQLIDSTAKVMNQLGFKFNDPQIRVSHPIMGRLPSAQDKKALDLLDHEKTLYYERMMYLFQIPEIRSTVNNQELSLVFGGIKSYSWDNLGKDHRSQQHFKFFIGFQVWICSNLCVSTDGVVLDFRTNSVNLIEHQIKLLTETFNPDKQINWLKSLEDYSLSEDQFARFIGRCRMYNHLPDKQGIPELSITDSQITNVVKGYYSDSTFSQNQGNISLWSLYNLLTEANKSSYIDGFLDRGVNAQQISDELIHGLESNQSWFL